MTPTELASKTETLLTPHLGVIQARAFSSTLYTNISLILDERADNILMVVQELADMLLTLCKEAKREDLRINIDQLMHALADVIHKYTDDSVLIEKLFTEKKTKDYIVDNIRQDKSPYTFNIELTNQLHTVLKQQAGIKEIEFLTFHHLMTMQIVGYFDPIDKKYKEIKEQIDDWINSTLQTSTNEQLIAEAQTQFSARDQLEDELRGYIHEKLSSIKPQWVIELAKKRKNIIEARALSTMTHDDKKKFQCLALNQTKIEFETSLRESIGAAIQDWCSTKPRQGIQMLAFERILSEALLSLELEVNGDMVNEHVSLHTPSIVVPPAERGPLINFLIIVKSLALEFLLEPEYSEFVIRDGELQELFEAFQEMMSIVPINIVNDFKVQPPDTFIENLPRQWSEIPDLILSPRQFHIYQQAIGIAKQLVSRQDAFKSLYAGLKQKEQETKQHEKEQQIQLINARSNKVSEPQVRTLISSIKHGKIPLFNVLLMHCNKETLITVLTKLSPTDDKKNLRSRIQGRLLELEQSVIEHSASQPKVTAASSIGVFSLKASVASSHQLDESTVTSKP